MDYKRSYLVLKICVIGGAIISFIGCSLSMKIGLFGAIVGVIGLAGMVYGLIQAVIFYKCPKCGKPFNIRGRRPDYCPCCGHNLEQEIKP